MKTFILNSTNTSLPNKEQCFKRYKNVQNKFIEMEKRKVDTLKKTFSFIKQQGEEDLKYVRELCKEATNENDSKVELFKTFDDEDEFFE